MQLKMRRIGVAVDPPRQPDRHCAKRREGTVPFRRFLVPRRETTGRDRPFSSFFSSFRPTDGGAAAQGQMRGRPIGARGAPPAHRPPARRGRSAPGPPEKQKKARAGRSPRGPARTRAKRKRPLLAGGVLLSHGLHRSTIGARGLNFRVRDGTGCASPAMAAGQQGAFSSAGPARPCPQGRTALESSSRAGTATACPPRAGGRGDRVRARTISTARLSGSPHLRLRPIQQVVCLCPYQKEDSSREGLPA